MREESVRECRSGEEVMVVWICSVRIKIRKGRKESNQKKEEKT